MMRWISYILVILLAIAFLLIGLVNTESVTFNYLVSTVQVPLLSVMLCSFVFGALIMILIFGFKTLIWKRRARRLQNTLDRQAKAQKDEAIKDHFETESAH